MFAKARSKHVLRLLALAVGALAIGGCASLSPDSGFAPVASEVRERTGAETRMVRSERDAEEVRKLVAERLQRPLSVDDAVWIALVNNTGLQALYAELGIADANLVQAGRLRNPRFSFSRLAGGDVLEIERKLFFDVASILAAPLLVKVERGRLEHAQLSSAMEAVRIAADARRAYVAAVAAAQTERYYEQVRLAADAGAELAQRLAQAGNWSRLAQARQQAFYADATAQLARARHAALAERERLVRLLGLTDDAVLLKLPERLPDLPREPRSVAGAEATALAQRLDIRLARRALDNTTEALGLVRATRFVSVFEVAYQNKNDSGLPRQNGYEIEIEVPLFDWGDVKIAKAEAIYRQAAFRLAETAGHARSEVRTAYDAYRTAYDLARHYRDEIVPLRKTISEEMLLRYNGMLVSVFELLADAREQIASVNAAIDAQRDFWLAEANLEFAMTGGEAGAAAVIAPRADTGGSAGPTGH
jgi:outer membrane protein TolC